MPRYVLPDNGAGSQPPSRAFVRDALACRVRPPGWDGAAEGAHRSRLAEYERPAHSPRFIHRSHRLPPALRGREGMNGRFGIAGTEGPSETMPSPPSGLHLPQAPASLKRHNARQWRKYGRAGLRRVSDEINVLIVIRRASRRSVSPRHSSACLSHRREPVCGQESGLRTRVFRRWTSTGGDAP